MQTTKAITLFVYIVGNLSSNNEYGLKYIMQTLTHMTYSLENVWGFCACKYDPLQIYKDLK